MGVKRRHGVSMSRVSQVNGVSGPGADRSESALEMHSIHPKSVSSATFVNFEEDIMANITRHTPFSVSDPFEMSDPLDNLFRGFFRPVQAAKDMPQIRMDVKEDEKNYAVHADIPGVSKDDIHVSIDGNTVSISAEVKKNAEQKDGEKVLHRERYFGRVSRSFALENEIDEAAASARYQDGVLELVLPKKTAAAAKRLAVQ
jgi:HSP20 family protein